MCVCYFVLFCFVFCFLLGFFLVFFLGGGLFVCFSFLLSYHPILYLKNIPCICHYQHGVTQARISLTLSSHSSLSSIAPGRSSTSMKDTNLWQSMRPILEHKPPFCSAFSLADFQKPKIKSCLLIGILHHINSWGHLIPNSIYIYIWFLNELLEHICLHEIKRFKVFLSNTNNSTWYNHLLADNIMVLSNANIQD